MFVLVFLLYGKSIYNDYGLDDHLVFNKTSELGWKGMVKAFKTGYMKNEQSGNISGYRPVTVASFAMEFALFGKHAAVSRIINLLLYSLTGVLLFFFLAALLQNIPITDYLIKPQQGIVAPPTDIKNANNGYIATLVSFITTVLFICHPIHSEVILNIKSRDEILAFLFAISAVFCLINASKLTIGRVVAAFLLSMLALLSKNTAVPTLLLGLLGYVVLHRAASKKIFFSIGLFVSVFLIAKILDKYLSDTTKFGRIWEYIENPLYTMSIIDRIPTGLSVMLAYLKLLFIPQPLLYYYGYNQVPLCTWTSIVSWFSLLLHSVLLFFAIRQYRKRPILSYAIAYYLLHAFVYSNIIKVGPGIIAERFFYSGTLGFCLAIAYIGVYIIQQKAQNKAIAFYVGAFLLGVCLIDAVLIQQRIPAWKNLSTLLKTDMPYLANSAKANLLYADVLVKDLKKATLADWQLAEKHYHRAIEIYPNYHIPYNNLGFFYLKTQRFAEANEILLKAQKLMPHSSNILYNLGSASLKLGMTDRAQTYFEQAVSYQPNTEGAMAAFGGLHNIYGNKGDTTAMVRNLMNGFIYHSQEPFFYSELMRYYADQQKLVYLRNLLQSVADTISPDKQKMIKNKIKQLNGNTQ